MKFKFLSMLLALSVIPVTNAYANDDEYETGQVVISASRIEQLIEDVPANIDVITSEELEKMGATSVQDVLMMQPGVYKDQQRGSALGIRGMGYEAVLYLIDGRRPVLSENKRDQLDELLATININNIERIEIIKGAAATMYGSDALGGVINIITKKGADPSGSVAVNYVSSGRVIANHVYDFGKVGNWTGKVESSITQFFPTMTKSRAINAVTGEMDRGGDNGTTLSNDSIGTNFSLGGGLGYYFNDNHDVYASYSHIRINTRSRAYTYDDTADGDYTYTDSAGNYVMFNNASLTYTGAIGSHQYTVMPVLSTSEWQGSKNYQYGEYGVDLMDAFPINDWNLITLGGDYKYSTLYHSASYSAVGDGNADPMHKIGAFVQDEILLFNESLILLPSVRFDYSNYGGSQFTSRFGTTYEFLPNQRLKFNIGQAYITPNLNSLGGAEGKGEEDIDTNDIIAAGVTKDSLGNDLTSNTTITGTLITVGNKELEPELGLNIDLRYEGSFGPLSAGIGGYYTTKDNAMASTGAYVEVYNDGAGSYTIYNTRYNIEGITTYSGIEASLGYSFMDYLTANFNYAFMHNTDSDGYKLSYYAPHTINGTIMGSLPKWDINATLTGQYLIGYNHTAETATNTDTVGDTAYNYFNINASISKNIGDKFTVVGAIDNLLQSAYGWEKPDGSYMANGRWSARTYKLNFTAKY